MNVMPIPGRQFPDAVVNDPYVPYDSAEPKRVSITLPYATFRRLMVTFQE